MKLTEKDIGKHFITNENKELTLTGIVEGNDVYPFMFNDGKTRSSNGEFLMTKKDHKFNILREIEQLTPIPLILKDEDFPEEYVKKRGIKPKLPLESTQIKKLTLAIPKGTELLEGEFEGYKVKLEKIK